MIYSYSYSYFIFFLLLSLYFPFYRVCRCTSGTIYNNNNNNNNKIAGEQEYLPRTRQAEGLSWLSAGSQLYESCLRWYLSSTSGDVTASAVHRVGRDAVANILNRIDQVTFAVF